MQLTLEGTLGTLPIEITDRLLRMLSDRDLVCVGRVNSWYRSMMVPILTERINHQMQNDGWRIYVNALSQLTVQDEQVALAEFWQQEAKLLGELRHINPDTLSLEFDTMPLDEDHGFRSGPLIEEETCRSILLPLTDPPRHIEIEVSLYFAKIGSDQRLERANAMGILTLAGGDICHRVLLEGQFQNRVNFGNTEDISVEYHVKPTSSSIRIEFQTISASPEWWLCQIDNPYDFYMQYISEHSIW